MPDVNNRILKEESRLMSKVKRAERVKPIRKMVFNASQAV